MTEYLRLLTPVVEEKCILMARGGTDSHGMALAIMHKFEHESNEVVVRAIGAGAVNQAVKGIAIARRMVSERTLDLVCRIGFIDRIVPVVDGSGEESLETRTAMVFRLSLQ